MVTQKFLYKVLDICSSQESVKEDVIKNHDNNLWWPNDISDSRKRLLIAGLSTRVSYNMINKYRKVIFDLDSYSYEELHLMNDSKLASIIEKIGLVNTRIKYLRSMFLFIDKYNNQFNELGNQELIKLIKENVNGASYKVAQCCTLYLKGYYSGIMPVDSGMKDMLLPCMGFNCAKGAIGHEISRIELEELVHSMDLWSLIDKNGYNKLKIPDNKPLTWWAHLVLIYYKRNFCNKHKSEICPLRKEVNKINQKCKINSKYVNN
jgi:endonuclease III